MHYISIWRHRSVVPMFLASLLIIATNGMVLAEEIGSNLPDEAALSARIGELETPGTKTNAQQQEMMLLLQARSFVQKTRESLARTAQFKKSAEDAPATLKTLERELSKPLSDAAAK